MVRLLASRELSYVSNFTRILCEEERIDRSNDNEENSLNSLESHHQEVNEAACEDDQGTKCEDHRSEAACPSLPAWVDEQRHLWGHQLVVAEWQIDGGTYRTKNGWQGHDLVHGRSAPVRVLDYYVDFGHDRRSLADEDHIDKQRRQEDGGVGTTLTGVVHFTKRAESHRGYCHGGSMCAIMDDVIGWTGFMATGSCRPWTGYTVQVDTSLKRPIPVDSILLVKAEITKVERRKVYVSASISDPEGGLLHAIGEGLVIVNKGVLREETTTA